MRVTVYGLALVLVMWTAFVLSWVALAFMRVSDWVASLANRVEVAYVLAKAEHKLTRD